MSNMMTKEKYMYNTQVTKYAFEVQRTSHAAYTYLLMSYLCECVGGVHFYNRFLTKLERDVWLQAAGLDRTPVRARRLVKRLTTLMRCSCAVPLKYLEK